MKFYKIIEEVESAAKTSKGDIKGVEDPSIVEWPYYKKNKDKIVRRQMPKVVKIQ